MLAFSFEKIAPGAARKVPSGPTQPSWHERLLEFKYRYRWLLAVLTMALPLFLLVVAFKLSAGN